MTAEHERAVLAGGCFWGMQDLLKKCPGVVSTRVGYTGGETPNATYKNHRGHAEAVEVFFDPAITNYRALLQRFFQIHNPTTINRQGNDVGDSYRSEIFTTSEAQAVEAHKIIKEVDASGRWPGKIVTQISPANVFWVAEPAHQDYLERIPSGYSRHFARDEWVLPDDDLGPSPSRSSTSLSERVGAVSAGPEPKGLPKRLFR